MGEVVESVSSDAKSSSSPRCVSNTTSSSDEDFSGSNNHVLSSLPINIKKDEYVNATMPLDPTSRESMYQEMMTTVKFNNSQCADLLINRNQVSSLKELVAPPSKPLCCMIYVHQ